MRVLITFADGASIIANYTSLEELQGFKLKGWIRDFQVLSSGSDDRKPTEKNSDTGAGYVSEKHPIEWLIGYHQKREKEEYLRPDNYG